MKYRFFLFDLDGTLVDTSPGILHSLRNTERILGLPVLPEETLLRFIGPALEDSYRMYYHASDEQLPVMVETYRSDYRQNSAHMAEVYPGVYEALDLIRSRGGITGVATLKHQSVSAYTLARYGFTERMDCIAAHRDGIKPDKGTLIRECLDALGCTAPGEAVFFGDSPYDGIGAQQVGVDFVALTYGFGFSDPASLEDIPMVFQCREPMDLVRFVNQATS